MKYSVQIVLSLFSDKHDMQKLAKSFPIGPERVAIRGSRRTNPDIPKHSYISFYSDAESWESELADHWVNFSQMVSENTDRLIELSQESRVEISIIVEHKGRFPSLYMPKELIEFAAKIGSPIDVDIYEENVGED